MPIYNYLCSCGKEQELYQPLTTSPATICECGLVMERVLRGRNHHPGSGWPFTTTHLTGKAETFASQKDLDRRCKELGVTHRPDTAWLDQEYQGVDFATGKQRYKEGSGLGVKGCWF